MNPTLARFLLALVTALLFGLSLLATLYPSYRASRLEPAAALRYE